MIHNQSLVDRVTSEYINAVGHPPQFVVFAPGRINLIGEHTDHNNGFVLPTAVDKGIYFAFGRSNSGKGNWIALDRNDSHQAGAPDEHERTGDWHDFVNGAYSKMTEQSDSVTSFNCVFSSDLPAGAGMSSSSALTCGILTGINGLFELGFNAYEIAVMAYKVERGYVGLRGGIMDQFASMLSKDGHFLLIDCEDQSYQHIPSNLGEYQLFLIHSNVHRVLTASDYNTRSDECKTAVTKLAAKYPEVESLRKLEPLGTSWDRSLLDETLLKRVDYVLDENKRVLQVVDLLQDQKWAEVGQVLYAGHDGMSNLFEISTPELDFIVEYTKGVDWILGSRLMGGGFGGCTINIGLRTPDSSFMDDFNKDYNQRFGISAGLIPVRMSDGAGII